MVELESEIIVNWRDKLRRFGVWSGKVKKREINKKTNGWIKINKIPTGTHFKWRNESFNYQHSKNQEEVLGDLQSPALNDKLANW